MLLLVVMSVSILGTATFCYKEKRMHPFELLGCWLAVTAINAPIFSFYLTNLHWISYPNDPEQVMVRILYTGIITPLLVTWLLDQVYDRKTLGYRAACYASLAVSFFLAAWTLHLTEIVQFTNKWGMLLYAPIKSITIAGAVISVKVMRYFMKKDGIAHDQNPRY